MENGKINTDNLINVTKLIHNSNNSTKEHSKKTIISDIKENKESKLKH